MKNICKVKAIHKIAGTIAIVIAAIVFCFTACGGGGSTPLTSPPSVPPVTPPEDIPPEDRPVKDRWRSFVDGSSTATLEYSVADDGVCTITVGGKAQPNDETDEWGIWKANIAYDYTAQAGTMYDYTFEAWTQSGIRELYFQYNTDNDEEIYFGKTVSLTTERQCYTIYGQPLSKGAFNHVEFLCADQLGIFYVKILEIKECQTGKLTITNFSGSPGLTQNNWLWGEGHEGTKPYDVVLYFGTLGEWYDEEGELHEGIGTVQIKGTTLTIRVWECNDEGTYAPFTGNITVKADDLWLCDDEYMELAYTNKVPITFTNGNATIDFKTQMQIYDGEK